MQQPSMIRLCLNKIPVSLNMRKSHAHAKINSARKQPICISHLSSSKDRWWGKKNTPLKSARARFKMESSQKLPLWTRRRAKMEVNIVRG